MLCVFHFEKKYLKLYFKLYMFMMFQVECIPMVVNF